MKFVKTGLAYALVLSGLALSSHVFAASSTTYGFVGVGDSSASSANVTSGMSSLFVEVIDRGLAESGANQVAFKFTNASSSSLTDVYFDDGSLLGIASIDDSGPTVEFSQSANPGNLSGGTYLDPDFVTTKGFSADSETPKPIENGVTSGEWLQIVFDLKLNQNYQSVIDALALPNGGGEGDLRIGLRVQGFADDGGASFVNIAAPVPEAKTYAMILAGLGLIGFTVLRRRSI